MTNILELIYRPDIGLHLENGFAVSTSDGVTGSHYTQWSLPYHSAVCPKNAARSIVAFDCIAAYRRKTIE